MTDLCADHRIYLAALADGELDLVPEETKQHVLTCEDCSRELETHQLLGEKLRTLPRLAGESLRDAEGRGSRAWRRALVPLAAAAAIAIVALGAHQATSGPDALAAAVSVADRQPAYHSSNPADLAEWCSHKYGNRVPQVAVSGLEPVGARMDWPGGIGVATVTYSDQGQPVHVSWLSRSVGGQSPSEVTVGGKPAVVVRAHGITAVVTGTTTETELVRVAQQVAAAE